MPVPVAKRGCHRDFLVYTGLFIVLSVCGICCLSGCKDKSDITPSRATKMRQQRPINSEKVADLQKKLKHLMQPVTYHYASVGKPDPFQPFLRTAPETSKPMTPKKRGAAKPEYCSTPLECMDIAQLTLVAIITIDRNNRIAMAQDAAGIGYFLYPNQRIGYHNGRVKKILSDRVIIREKVKDIHGNLITRKRVMLLHPEEK